MSDNTTLTGDEFTEEVYQSDYKLCVDLAVDYIKLKLELEAVKKTKPESSLPPFAIDGYEAFLLYTRETNQYLKQKLAHNAKIKQIELQVESAMNMVAKHFVDGIWFAVEYNGKKYGVKVNNLVSNNKVHFCLWDKVMAEVK